MDVAREGLIQHIVQTSRQFFHLSLQLGGDRYWTEVDLTMPQLKVLFTVVATGKMTMSHLARALGMELSTATGVADRLIAQALVQRERDPADRRLVWLLPTEAGVGVVDRLIQVGASQFNLVAAQMTVDELTVVAKAQDLMYKAMLDHQSMLAAEDPGPSTSGVVNTVRA